MRRNVSFDDLIACQAKPSRRRPGRLRRFCNGMQSVTLGIKDDAGSMKMPLQIITISSSLGLPLTDATW